MSFKNLTPIASFEQAFDVNALEKVPSDWYIIVTDIVGSTKAIEAGKYKDVNTAGGLAVMAVANAFEDFEFPFVFGGDGVTMLIPPNYIDKVKDVLFDTEKVVKELFGLELRVGYVAIAELYQDKFKLEYGKLTISKYYEQVILHGNGVDEAEHRIKKKGDQYLIKETSNPELKADFTGFTCRWQDIPSSQDETIAIIIKVREDKVGNPEKSYSEILMQLKNFLGNIDEHHPLKIEHLKTSSNSKTIAREAKATSKSSNKFSILITILKIKFEVFITKIAMVFKIPIKALWYDLSKIKDYQIISSDYRKYDGTLKMVVAIKTEKRKQLEQYLEKKFKASEVFYGLHVSNRALMTCLLHSDTEKEVHFIDAADGGYALAAKQLKEQIRNL